MRRLLDQAQAHEFIRMFSVDSAVNYNMRKLAKNMGFSSFIDPDDATQVIHSLEL